MKIFELPLKHLELFGWSENKISKSRATFLIIMHVLCVELIAICELIFLVTSDNVRDFSEVSTTVPSFLGLSLRTLNILRMKSEMQQLLKTLEDLIQYENWNVAQKGTKLRQRIKQIDTISKTAFGLMVASIFFGSFRSFVIHDIPYKMWLPFDHKSNQFLLWSTIAYQLLACFIYIPLNFTLEAIPLFFIFYLVGLTEELSDKLKGIIEEYSSAKKDDKIESTSNQPAVTDQVNTRAENEVHLKELLQCIEIQLKIKSLVVDFGDIYSKSFWVQGFFSSWILCTTVFWVIFCLFVLFMFCFDLFMFSSFKAIENNVMIIVAYMPILTLQILVPCYAGTLLTLANEKLPVSLFHSNWAGESKEFKMAMLIFMENAKKAVKISAFGIFDLSLENFVRIINWAYSLYAILVNFRD